MNLPDPEEEKQEPVSRGAADMDPSERQFWDLDEDDGLLDDPRTSVVHSKDSAAEEKSPAPEKPASLLSPDEGSPIAPAAEEESAGKDRRASRKATGIESVSLIAFGVLLLALLGGIGWVFLSGIPTDDPNAPADLPVKGERVTIKDLDTYWRIPNEESDQGIQSSVKVIPAAKLVLGKGKGKGALRVFYEDDEGRLTGDPVTLSFADGTFTDSGQAEAEAYCTVGFTDHGDFPAYVTEQIDRWFLIIKEGPDAKARGSDFVEILRTPISPEHR